MQNGPMPAHDVADLMSVTPRSFNCDGGQWYFGTREHGFYLHGISELVADLAYLEDCLRVEHLPEGAWVEPDSPALTVTIEHPEHVYLGNLIEVLVYQRLWYPSTVTTLLRDCKATLERHGFSSMDVSPKIRRGCSSFGQMKMAEAAFSRVFYPLDVPPFRIANHNDILLDGEPAAFAANDHVMVDTVDLVKALEVVKPHNVLLVDTTNPVADTDWLLTRTSNDIVIVQSCENIEGWKALVERYAGNSRVSFTIGSEVFANVSRDTLGFVYKVCAVLVDGIWQPRSKNSSGKRTLAGPLRVERR